MIRSSSLSRFVSGVVAALFVLCQSTSGVGARLAGDPASGAAVPHESCLGKSPDAGGAPQSNLCQALCQTQHAWSTPSPALASSATDLPALSIPAGWIPASVLGPVAAESPILGVASPPLFIVHCRLRN